MTPYEIGILLHYHCRADDHEDLHRSPPVWAPTILWACQEGLLRPATPEETACDKERPFSQVYRPTERLHAYAKALQRVPLPSVGWTIEWPTDDKVEGR